ncbi:2Fe-2S iron-sulfur cluster-binding protein [Streptomyces sp. NPDC001571]
MTSQHNDRNHDRNNDRSNGRNGGRNNAPHDDWNDDWNGPYEPERAPERENEHGYGQVPRHGGWEPVPHGGEYEPDATAFVQLPPDMDLMGAPLAAPGHGYVPPMIVPLTPAAATDPGATGVWRIPTEPTGQGAPGGSEGEPAPGAQTVVWPEPPAPTPVPATPTHPAHDPSATAQWNFADEPSLAGTGQWTIPVADGELPEESGEFTTSSLIEQWGSTPPATLPGGAPAPWANQLPVPPAPEPVEAPAPAAPEAPEAPAAHATAPMTAFAPEPPPEAPLTVEPLAEALPETSAPAGPEAHGTREAHETHGVHETDGVHEDYGVHEARRVHETDGAHAAYEASEASEASEVHGAGNAPENLQVPENPEPPMAAESSHSVPVAPSVPAVSVPAAGVEPGAEPGIERGIEPEPQPEAALQRAHVPAPAPAPEAETAPEPGPEGAAPRPDGAAPDPRPGPEGIAPGPEGIAPGPEDIAPGPEGVAPEAESAAPEPALTGAPDLEHPRASYVLRVNGADRPVTEAWVGESLLYVLRERLGLAGAKDGCSQGECGACNVQVDGRLVASCLVPAATTAGSEVRTVEGLATDGEPSDVQRALAASGAVQCGFCIPGMAMTVHDLLEGNHAPTELETRQALCGNLCRCSGYRGVLDAVKDVVAGREAAGAALADEARIPHQAPPGAGSAKPPHTHDGGMA